MTGGNNEAHTFLSRGGQAIVRMRGLPYDCTALQVVSVSSIQYFLSPLNPVKRLLSATFLFVTHFLESISLSTFVINVIDLLFFGSDIDRFFLKQ